MKKVADALKNFVVKHGNILACCAFMFVSFTSNSSSMILFHEPEEPKGLESFKKFNN